MKNFIVTKGSLVGAAIAAIAASLCCVGPLVLLAFGVSGTWIANLTLLEPIRPFAIVVTIILLGIAFWKLHISPPGCGIGKPCASPKTLFWYRIIYWVITITLLLLITFPWYAFLFY